MRDVDSDALRGVAALLGVGNPVTAVGQVAFDDETLQQVFDVGGSVGRALAPATTDGLFTVILENTHTGATATLTEAVNLYDRDPTPTGGAFGSIWPNPVPPGADLWILSAWASLSSGAAANFDSALLQLFLGAPNNAFASTGVALGTGRTHALVSFDAAQTFVSNAIRLLQAGSELVEIPLRFRVPRRCQIQWLSRNANATAITTRVTLLVGYMGAGLGQDGAI